jgi:hypothetical protein
MGMTYWIHTLLGRSMSQDSDDHSMMHYLSDELDTACDILGVPALSSFADFTDLEYCLSAEDDEDEPDAETGYPYGIDQMDWHDPAAGLQCMEALRQHVGDGWNDELEAVEREMLIEELDDCIATLKALPGGGKFHLAVIM